ncbi:serine-protein kinase ATM isoform X2 [Aplysia californica]|uniref:non-specific serine/threonine protein kinase n=1 Tax=Aplysia californica TaxID=6500 RepID=A0ABM1W1D2_APLCA|nr:serine-protein kinase ATM isoform X2 [Aplysia californica]
MDGLSDVYSCLRALDASKVTERKNNAAKLQNLLSNSSVVETLDDNSDNHSPGSKTLTWNVVLKGVMKYVDLETSLLQTAKESQSAATLNNRDKKKLELAALFMFVIRTANERGPRLRLDWIMNWIRNALCDDYMREAFGLDFSNVLLKHVLRVRSYWLEISSKEWRDLLTLYCKLYEEGFLRQDLCAKVIKKLIQGSVLQGEVSPRKLFSFFSRVLQHFRDLQAASIVENVLSSLTTFCHAIAPACPAQLCEFAESHLDGLLYLWQNASTERVKEEMIDLLHLLVLVHHPAGAATEGEGAYAHDWTRWKVHLASLHESIVADINETGGRFRFSSGLKVSILKQRYIDLAVAVFKQLPGLIPASPEEVVAFTQVSQMGDRAGATPAKRQRLSVENKPLVELVKTCSNSLQAVPWLQILCALLRRHSESFSRNGLVNALGVLALLLHECKRGQLFTYVFECLSALTDASVPSDRETEKIWLSVWSSCSGTINSRQAEVEGYQDFGFQLMAGMLFQGLVRPGKEIWNLFLPNFSHPSPSSDGLLTALVHSQGLAENYCPNILGSSSMSKTQGAFPLRTLLVNWLLSQAMAENLEASARNLTPTRTAQLIYALALQDPLTVMKQFKEDNHQEEDISQIEKVHLRTAFGSLKSSAESRKSVGSRERRREESEDNNPQVDSVVEHVLKTLGTISRSLSELLEPSVETIEFLAWYSCTVVKLLFYVGPDGVPGTRLKQLVKVALEKCTGHFVNYVKKKGTCGLLPALKVFHEMFWFKGMTSMRMFWVVEVIRCDLSAAFVDLVVDMASGKLEKKREVRPSSHRNRYDRHRQFEWNEQREGSSHRGRENDLDFDLEPQRADLDPRNGASNTDLDFDERDASTNNNTTLPAAADDNHQFLGEDLLVEAQKVRLACVKLLCGLISYDRQLSESEEVPVRAEMDIGHLKEQLFALVEGLEPIKPVFVHTLITITEHVLTPVHVISGADVKALLKAFKLTAKNLAQDQRVCCAILQCLQKVIPHLAEKEEMPSSDIKLCRDMFFNFMTDFGSLASEGTVQLKLDLAKTHLELLKYDRACAWGTIKVPQSGDSGDSNGFSLCTVSQVFPDFLRDEIVEVSLFVAENVSSLFTKFAVDGTEMQEEKRTQNKAFDNLFLICNDFLNIRGSPSPVRRADMERNQQAACLYTLTSIICCSPICEKSCLLALCQVVADERVHLSRARKALDVISGNLGYSSSQDYLKCHLPYLVHNWLAEDMVNSPVAEFPYRLLGHTTLDEFVRANQDLIVSEILVTQRSLTDLESLLTSVQCDVRPSLRRALPVVLVHILPCFAVKVMEEERGTSSQPSVAARQSQRAAKCFDIVKERLSEQDINDCIFQNLGSIVVGLLSSLHISNDAASGALSSMIYPEPNPPFYNQRTIQATLDYMAQNFTVAEGGSGRGTSLITVLAKVPDGLQRVLLSLSTLMWCEHRPHEKARALHMYGLFVGMVLGELAQGLDGGWAAVVRDVVTRLLILLGSSLKTPSGQVVSPGFEEELILTALHILQRVCAETMKICPDEFANYAHQIVDTVVSAVGKSEAISKAAVTLLRAVLSSSPNNEELKASLRTLNPLPLNVPSLDELREGMDTLCGEQGLPLVLRLQNLLQAISFMSVVPSHGLVLRLNRLTRDLLTERREVLQMAVGSEGLCLLKKVVCALLSLTEWENQPLVAAAGSCLGAIGPVDLQTMTLPAGLGNSSSSIAMETFRNQEFEKYCWLIHKLDDCLLDKSLEVVRTAGEILQSVFSTASCVRFEAEYNKALRSKSFVFFYLHPFKRKTPKLDKMAPPPAPSKKDSLTPDTLDNQDLWLGVSGNSPLSHEEWIRNLTTALLRSGAVQDEMLAKIEPMCAFKTQFCEEALPYLVQDILLHGGEDFRRILSYHFTSFFRSHCAHKELGSSSAETRPLTLRKRSVQTMLRVVQFLRKQTRPALKRGVPQTEWQNNFWLDVDYLEVARAAQFCSAHFSAILFTEIWWERVREETSLPSTGSSSHTQSDSQQSALDPLTQVSSQGSGGQGAQRLLLEVYWSIGDPDGIYGCGAGRQADPSTRMQTYLHELQYERALTTQDMAVTHGTTSSPMSLLQTLHMCGMDYSLQGCLEGLQRLAEYPPPPVPPTSTTEQTSALSAAALYNCAEIEELQFQAAWELGRWDIRETLKQSRPESYHQSVYRALSSLRDGHLKVAEHAVNSARMSIMAQFECGAESCESLYPFLSQLQCLSHLDRAVQSCARVGDSSPEESTLGQQLSWSVSQRGRGAVNFKHERPLLQLLSSLGGALSNRGEGGGGRGGGEVLETTALWTLAVSARKAGQFQLAEKAVYELKRKASLIVHVGAEKLQLEEARLFWARAESNIALNIMQNLIKDMTQDVIAKNPPLYPEVLSTYGNWLAETKSETPSVIISDFLQKTVDTILEQSLSEDSSASSWTKTALEGFASLARFADEQYQLLADYMKSPMYETKRDLLRRSRSELEECHQFKGASKYLKVMEKTSAIDEQELEALENDCQRYLHQALENYLRCLKTGDLYDLKIFRVVSLWFDNCSSLEVNQMIEDYSASIQSHKFLPLYYQLAARMSTRPTDGGHFQAVLAKLMERVAQEHPHHALWVIMALAHAYKDDELLQKDKPSRMRKRKSTEEEEVAEEDRIQAAKILIEQLKGSERLGEIVKNMELLCVAYIQLANWSVEQYKTEKRPVPLLKQLMITKISRLDNVQMPSVELKVDPSSQYENLVSVKKFGADFRLAGGINLPKIITCTGSDGRERTQLVKGRDDLRQDAVMQQVFALVNQLLGRNSETHRRQLSIRTYKVVPLSQKCGLLEWCEGTKPLGEYLIGSPSAKGAHTRYRPKDWLFKDCRLHLSGAGNNPEKRYKAYQEICSHFKPVFRHFFMENFPEPSTWFERRLAYTRSVATNSIVGHILGLGDRHLMNILIDLQTAELVHIDLGIAFEQGRILPTPETVPFRLTRDIVDGMGITGVEGVFRRCCEKTMQVMRGNSEALLTIVQVLLHDPLSHWSLSPQQALTIQRKREHVNADTMDMTSSGTVPSSGQVAGPSVVPRQDGANNNHQDAQERQNKLAERTLLRLRQKLAGQEERVPLSVSGQVTLLIQTASDPRNLSKLFAGWQPYL